MDRFLIPLNGVDRDGERAGLAWLQAEALDRRARAGILVPTVPQISQLDAMLGREGAVKAERDREFTMGGVKVEIFSAKAAPGTFEGALLVPWADESIVGEAEQMGPVAICVLSWSIDDLSGWTRAHRPVDPRSAESVDATTPKLDPVIEVGLAIIGPKSLANRSDLKRVTQNLKAFNMTGGTFNPEEIRIWALADGWAAKEAKTLADVAQKILEGRPVRDSKMTLSQAEEVVARLRAAAV